MTYRAIPEVLKQLTTMSIPEVLKLTALTSEQVRAARMLLRWEQRDLAEASGISLPSIQKDWRRSQAHCLLKRER